MAIFEVTPSSTPNMPISVAGWLFRRSPILLRRGAQAAAFYFTTLAAEKAFDAAHEAFPENQFIGKGDTVMRKTVKVENLMLSGAGSIAMAAYQAIPAAKAAPAALREPTPASDLPNIGGNDVALQTRQAAFQPNPKQRKRMPLNTQLDTGVADHCSMTALTLKEDRPDPETERLNRAELARHQPRATEIGPDGMALSGGYEPATSITSGEYMQPSARPDTPRQTLMMDPLVIVAAPFESVPFSEANAPEFRPHEAKRFMPGERPFEHRTPRVFHSGPFSKH